MGYILAGVSSTASAPKGMGGWGKEPEALASAAASSPWAVWRMRMRNSVADPKGRGRNPTDRFPAVDHSSNIMTKS